MGSDMVVALKKASANGTTLFGLNHHAVPGQRHSLHLAAGHPHEAGQSVTVSDVTFAQVKQTFAVLGLQPAGAWGFQYGVNECGVAAGVTDWKSRIAPANEGLTGLDLVRLALERGKSAQLAVEALTDLLERHGQTGDHIYLFADKDEAFLLETCGRYWALLECGHSRVVTDTAMIRQDWRRLAPGLATHVIEKGWWQDDGSKIDFVRCLSENTDAARSAQRRWGRASLTVSQQHGAIDLHFLRHMLADHHSDSRHLFPPSGALDLASGFLVDLHASEGALVAWIAFGDPRAAVYFPVCLAGDLPTVFGAGTIEECARQLAKLATGKERDRERLTQALERLQLRFDQDAEDLQAKAHDLANSGKQRQLGPIATEMMHQHVEQFGQEYRRLCGVEEKVPSKAAVAEEELFYA